MNKKEIDKIRKILTEERDQLLKLVKKTRADENELIEIVGDSADLAYDSLERELLFELNDKERERLELINHAIKKLGYATFGKCEKCGKKISVSRIKAVPFARFCIKCKSSFEKPRK